MLIMAMAEHVVTAWGSCRPVIGARMEVLGALGGRLMWLVGERVPLRGALGPVGVDNRRLGKIVQPILSIW